MSIFSTLPVFDLGTTLTKGDLIENRITSRDRLRLTAALDCYVVANFQQNTKFDKISVRVIGQLDTRTNITIPPSGNIGFWPGFDLKRVAIQSSNLTTFIKKLQPHLAQNALTVYPLTKIDLPKLERDVGERMIMGRQYEMPTNVSAHERITAASWVSTILAT